MRKYSFNERYFEHIDTEPKAYWLGFIGADGCVKRQGVHLRLKASDRSHIEKFRNDVGASQPITTEVKTVHGRRFECSGIMLCSMIMRRHLIRHGVTPNKTKTFNPDAVIFGSLQRHFWRGMLDGDGCIRRFRSSGQWSVSLCGSFHAVCDFSDFMGCVTNCWPKQRFYKGCFYVELNGNASVKKLVSRLYIGATISLDRKRLLAEEILAQPIVNQSRKHHTVEELLSLFAEMRDWGEVAKKLGTSRGRLWIIAKRIGCPWLTRFEELTK